MSLLKMHDVHASYGRANVLFGMSLDLSEGEVITLLGRNGMGRSTTVKCLFGLLPIQSGVVEVEGGAVNGKAPHDIARLGLGLVPEGRQVFPTLSVRENLVATARGAARNSAGQAWTLERVYKMFPRLQQREQNMGWQLSGGEQQMLAIGRALMTNPRILVLDEATEGLAPLIREEIWEALRALKKDGMAQIVIDKNLSDVATFADRHYVLEKGRVVWSGSTDDLNDQMEKVEEMVGV